MDHLAGVHDGRRIAGAHALVDLLEGVVFVADAYLGVFAKGLDERAVVHGDVDDLDLLDAGGGYLLDHRRGDGIVPAGDDGLGARIDQIVLHDEHAQILLGVALARRKRLEVVEEVHDLLVGAVAERPQEGRRVEFPAAAALIHETPHHVVRVEHHLDPAAAVGDDPDGKERLAVGVHLPLGRDAGRTVELRDDHAFGAVDDESAVGRHDRHVAEKHVLFAHVVAVAETERRIKRARVRLAVDEGLEIRFLRRVEMVAYEIKAVAAVKRRDGEYFLEYGLEALRLALCGRDVRLQKLLIRLRLDLDEIRRRLGHALKLAEYLSFRTHLLAFLLFLLVKTIVFYAFIGPEVW